VYFIKPMDGLEVKANLIPAGSLVRAEPINTMPTHPLSLVFTEANEGQMIKIEGYDLSPSPAKPGDKVAVTLYWQSVQPLAVDYTSFVHVINPAGQGVTQSDHQPGGDYYPSSFWQPGETLRDQHTLTLPTDLPAGTYELRVGMYYQPEPGVIQGLGNEQVLGLLVVASE
jgi:hypothetical protein